MYLDGAVVLAWILIIMSSLVHAHLYLKVKKERDRYKYYMAVLSDRNVQIEREIRELEASLTKAKELIEKYKESEENEQI